MWIYFVSAAVFAAILIAAVSFVCAHMAFSVPREPTRNPHLLLQGEQYDRLRDTLASMVVQADALPFENMSITSSDGLTLRGRFYAAAPGAPVDLMFHGYRGNAVRDFAGGLCMAVRAGHSVLLVDQRGHCESGGRFLTFGVKEQSDCLSWARYAASRFGSDTPLVLVGISMGAATVLAANREGLPDSVRGVIADCGYTSPREIIRKVLRDSRLPVALVYALISLGARLFYGFSPDSLSVPDSLRSARVPVLFLHGEDDRFVPCEMSRQNYDACITRKTLVTFPDAGHGLSYPCDPLRYEAAVLGFYESIGAAAIPVVSQ